MSRDQITADKVREILDYNPGTGAFVWRVRPSPAAAAGDEAGCFDRGYIRIKIKGVIYPAHALAWLHYYGEWPTLVDHINRNPTDNRIENLRVTSLSQNRANSCIRKKGNKSGLKGVMYNPDMNKWFVRIGINGKYKYLGSWEDKRDAAMAYDAALVNAFGEFACTNKSLGLI